MKSLLIVLGFISLFTGCGSEPGHESGVKTDFGNNMVELEDGENVVVVENEVPYPHKFNCGWGLDLNAIVGGGGFTCSDGKHNFSVAYASLSIGASVEAGRFDLSCSKIPTTGWSLAVVPLRATFIASRTAPEWLFRGDALDCRVETVGSFDKVGLALSGAQVKPGIVVRWPDSKANLSSGNLKQEETWRKHSFLCNWGIDLNAIVGGGGYTCSDGKHRFSVAYASISMGGSLEAGSFELKCNKIPQNGVQFSYLPINARALAGRSAAEWLVSSGGAHCRVDSAEDYEKLGVSLLHNQLKPGVIIRWDHKN